MVVFPVTVRSISHRCRRLAKPYFSRLVNDQHFCSSNFTRQWQFHSSRFLILEPVSDSVKLRYLSDSDSGIVELNLDRPGAKNAIGKCMLRGLQHSLEAISGDLSTKVMMISSSVPKVFCAGADLKERRAMSPIEVQSFVNNIRSTFSLLEALHIPTIAVIEGAALGGGLEMALSCDLRICGEGAVMGLPETGLAIIPGAGGTQRLSRLIGKSTAKELIFTGRKVSGSDALSMGLANYCVPPGFAYSKALEIARQIIEKGVSCVCVIFHMFQKLLHFQLTGPSGSQDGKTSHQRRN